jgi:hypothetical protein
MCATGDDFSDGSGSSWKGRKTKLYFWGEGADNGPFLKRHPTISVLFSHEASPNTYIQGKK